MQSLLVLFSISPLSIADQSIDRRNENVVRHYLSQRYCLKGVHILNIEAYSASVVLTRDA